MAAYTDNKKKNNQKWDAANLDRISLALPKGTRDQIKQAAAAAGESMNHYIYAAIARRIQQDAGNGDE